MHIGEASLKTIQSLALSLPRVRLFLSNYWQQPEESWFILERALRPSILASAPWRPTLPTLVLLIVFKRMERMLPLCQMQPACSSPGLGVPWGAM